MILVMDTASDPVFFGLWQGKWQAKIIWPAERNLSAGIIGKLEELYQKAGGDLNDTEKIIVANGPGSFTGLRIGLSVANALAFARNIPIVAIEKEKEPDKILQIGLKKLADKTFFSQPVEPAYGADLKVSKPKK